MENATQAIQIAFSVLVFVVALSISIASFGQANTALQSIVNYNNNRTTYTYVEQSEAITRKVGIETIIPTMYRAYKENYRVVFYKANGEIFPLYKDNKGNEINYIDLEKETWGNEENATKHLDKILNEELYEEIKQYTFIEEIGEYYIEDKVSYENTGEISNVAQVNKTKKRVITYTILK